jgi:hypothetical protein
MNYAQEVEILTGVLFLILIAAVCWRLYRRRSYIGSGAAGTVYDLMNQDRRNAVEIIVEERAEARDPEDKDGNLPDLEQRPR